MSHFNTSATKNARQCGRFWRQPCRTVRDVCLGSSESVRHSPFHHYCRRTWPSHWGGTGLSPPERLALTFAEQLSEVLFAVQRCRFSSAILIQIPLTSRLPLQAEGAQQLGAGAQQLGAGAQQVGAGAQQVGAGAQQVGAGAQQLLQ